MITVDTSAFIAAATDEPARGHIVALLRTEVAIVPNTVSAEMANALTKLVRRDRVSLETAVAIARTFLRLPVITIPVELPETIELASRLGVYAYDAFVIRCALTSGTPLLSLDRRQCDAARAIRIPVVEIDEIQP